MITSQINLISNEIVHKVEKENVFIYNLRRKLQNFFTEEQFCYILKNINEEEQIIFNLLYQPIPGDMLIFRNKISEKKSDTYYKLISIIISIDADIMNNITNNIAEEDKNLLLSVYIYSNECNKYILTRDLTDEEEKQILLILDNKKHYVSDEFKSYAAEILEKLDNLPKSDIIYANMYVNKNHDFFFEHNNEHVPGIMIMETFRQFCVAVNHVYGKVPIKDAQLVLECLDSKYFKYTELGIPIILKGYIKNYKWDDAKGYWTYLDFESDVLQNNILVAHFRLYGQIISTKLFKRIRNKDKEKNFKSYRYEPLAELSDKYAFKLLEINHNLPINLINLSLDGFMLQSEYFKVIDEQNTYNFLLFFSNIGFISGTCKKIWQNNEEKKAGFQIVDINNDNLQNLKEAITQYCHVCENRHIF
ncbi:MAG: hypothetical protein JXB50_05780 [Spirochaetes bacterium]|nr:hypothetical protein [Spirochaetota bacterium]